MPAFPASTTVLDSMLFRDAFGTPEMREVFSDVALVARYAGSRWRWRRLRRGAA
ncbi:hypothetical protein ABH977_002937 [Bradyrhizobium ottawaense]